MGSLIISNRADIHAEALLWGLEREGLSPHLLDTHHLLDRHQISIRHSPADGVKVVIDGQEVGQDWPIVFRRPFAKQFTDFALHQADIEYARLSAERFFSELHYALAEIGFCVDPVRNSVAANRKALQLHIAREAGLQTAATLMTNVQADVRTFAQEGAAVTKSFRPFVWTQGEQRFGTPTAILSDALLDRAGGTIAACPSIFQRYLPSDDEVRVVCIGKNVFAASLGWSNLRAGGVDWRSHIEQIEVHRTELPDQVERSILNFMARAGMRYGAFDFIRRGNDFYFLEVNPGGQWIWMSDEERGLPLLDCFVKFLTARSDDYLHEGPIRHSTRRFYEERGAAFADRLKASDLSPEGGDLDRYLRPRSTQEASGS